jgi:hypothetical protein
MSNYYSIEVALKSVNSNNDVKLTASDLFHAAMASDLSFYVFYDGLLAGFIDECDSDWHFREDPVYFKGILRAYAHAITQDDPSSINVSIVDIAEAYSSSILTENFRRQLYAGLSTPLDGHGDAYLEFIDYSYDEILVHIGELKSFQQLYLQKLGGVNTPNTAPTPQGIITALTANASKAAKAKHLPHNRVKEEALRLYQERLGEWKNPRQASISLAGMLEGNPEYLSTFYRGYYTSEEYYDDKFKNDENVYVYDPKHLPVLPKYWIQVALLNKNTNADIDPEMYGHSEVYLIFYRDFVDTTAVEMVSDVFQDLNWKDIAEDIVFDPLMY